MICQVCGLEYGLSHTCPGPLSTESQRVIDAGVAAPPDGGLGYYLGQALAIVRWDDIAIRRNAKDPRFTLRHRNLDCSDAHCSAGGELARTSQSIGKN